MKNKPLRPALKLIGLLVLFVFILGGSTPGIARADSNQETMISELADTAMLYLPVILKNFDSSVTYDVFLPLVIREVDEPPPPGEWDVLFSETFEGAWPDVWDLNESAGYAWSKRSCRGYLSSSSAWAIGGGSAGSVLPCDSQYPPSISTQMTYGPFSLEGYPQARLVFRNWLNIHVSDWFQWRVSINGSDFYGYEINGSSAGKWDEVILDFASVPTLGNIIGQSEVWIRFIFVTNGSSEVAHGVYLDNVQIQTCDGTCSTTPSAIFSDPNVNIREATDPIE